MPKSTKEKLINALATCEGGISRFRPCFDSDRSVIDVLKHFKSESPLEDQLQFDLAKRQLLSHFEGMCLIPDSMPPHRKFSQQYSMMDSPVFNSLPERDTDIVC
jgi:hypothetical protein